MITASQTSEEVGQRDRLVEGKRDEGMDGLPMAAIWECYERLGCKVRETEMNTVLIKNMSKI